MSNTAKYMSKKSLPSMMGLVMGRTKHCCVKIIFLIIGSSITTLFVITFLLVGSITSNFSSFGTSPVRY